jgi:hypothetical protein
MTLLKGPHRTHNANGTYSPSYLMDSSAPTHLQRLKDELLASSPQDIS